MASVIVDGLALPVAVAGHVALDFTNTRAGWGEAVPKEYLHTPAHLALWAREHGLLPTAVPASQATLKRALALREALYPVVLGRGEPTDWALVNREVRAAAAGSRLTPTLPSRSELIRPTDPDAALLAIARVVGEFLTDPAAGHVGACPGTGCGWLFTDPRDRRRWCSMAWCGNRNKARRHAERARPGSPPSPQ